MQSLLPHFIIWPLFAAIVAISLAIDLGAIKRLIKKTIHSQTTKMTTKQALTWTIIWISLALGFSAFIYVDMGPIGFNEYLAAFTVEKTLSIDNVFMFLLIFASLAIPGPQQRKALTIGILAAIAMRIPLLLVGAELIESIHWIVYLFGGLLIFTAIKMMVEYRKHIKAHNNSSNEKIDVNKNIAIRLLKKVGVKQVTPLMAAIAMILVTDLIFAIDSIPAVLAVSHEPFIILTSNIFALLGLRALFFVIQESANKFTYLKPALIIMLVFIGAKMLVAEYYHISVEYSLMIIVSVIGAAIAASMIKNKRSTIMMVKEVRQA